LTNKDSNTQTGHQVFLSFYCVGLLRLKHMVLSCPA